MKFYTHNIRYRFIGIAAYIIYNYLCADSLHIDIGGTDRLMTVKRVGTLDGNTLDVELSNGHTLLLDFTGILKMPEYSHLNDPTLFCEPKTDGNSIYWSGGIEIPVKKLFEILNIEDGQ